MATTPTPDPAVLRRRLRNELRKAREAAQMTQREVAEAMDWSLSKLIRIETGQVSIGTNDLRALLVHYGITDHARLRELITTARAARERSWWNSYRDVASPEYLTFLGYESSASHIRNFQPILVPGLLQTEDYAREAISTLPGRSAQDVETLVNLRLERQRRLLGDGGPRMYFVLDEAVIRRVVGSPEKMRDQLNHLIALGKQPNIDVLVVPFTAGLNPLSHTPMVHFEFSGPDDEDVLYIEGGLHGDLIVSESAVEEAGAVNPSEYLELFWTVEHAARKHDALALIQNAVESLATL